MHSYIYIYIYIYIYVVSDIISIPNKSLAILVFCHNLRSCKLPYRRHTSHTSRSLSLSLSLSRTLSQSLSLALSRTLCLCVHHTTSIVIINLLLTLALSCQGSIGLKNATHGREKPKRPNGVHSLTSHSSFFRDRECLFVCVFVCMSVCEYVCLYVRQSKLFCPSNVTFSNTEAVETRGYYSFSSNINTCFFLLRVLCVSHFWEVHHSCSLSID